METITITFSDVCENHIGMQKIGTESTNGFSVEKLEQIKNCFDEKNLVTEMVNLNKLVKNIETDEACVLIIKRAVDYLLRPKTSDDLLNEQKDLDWDTKAFMYGRVLNKNARYNLCFSDKGQEPDYENGKGRIISFNEVPILKKIRDKLIKISGQELLAEGNYYYDISKCGIGFHGDAERKKVIGVRLGCSIPLVFQWFHDSKAVGKNIKLELDHGDIYFMSEKATRNDWKKRSLYTLRHAAGADKFLQSKN